jgi:alginate O-acetyltransferase complex protein AlgI
MYWWVAIASYLHLYFNFAGYTDIAIGASRLFGLGIMENFDWPILAPNIGVFWKRWHMSLTGWCMTYIYMPVLGTFRRPNLATYIVFVAIALWHAASINWLMWGLYHATGLVLFQMWSRFKRKRKWTWTDRGRSSIPWKGFAIALTFLFVSAGEMLTLGGVENFTDLGHVGKKLIFLSVEDPARVPRPRHH